DLFPGGENCALQYVPTEGRPFMGPNLYITPPGSMTHFHQDGHGTVDSGHQCLTGRNRVIMLRRLSEHNKKRAMNILKGASLRPGGVYVDEGLYTAPHAPGEKPSWPTDEQIEELRKV
ncbi:unnamed protein product, partial [Choristocarpus tenellus]